MRHHAPQKSVGVGTVEVQVDGAVFGKAFQIFQLKNKSWVCILTFGMNLCLVPYSGYAYQIQVFHSLALDVRHEVVQLVQCDGRWEGFRLSCVVKLCWLYI